MTLCLGYSLPQRQGEDKMTVCLATSGGGEGEDDQDEMILGLGYYLWNMVKYSGNNHYSK